ncbi:hypothetical protein G4B88_012072 [Cannabis sativa]|uniref:Uncharacterized protein n=1 Tax=Cannabis sativa TaxID=3483 RepID=A0A7J6ETK1_CANSA|nr:hypothetical protein G4B88_012072 [Cannabis sativa]
MAKFNCFSVIGWKKKSSKDNDESAKVDEFNQAPSTLQIRVQQPLKSSTFGVTIPLGIDKNSECNIKVISHESPPVGCEAAEVAYEGEDEHEENSSIKRNLSDFDLKVHEKTNSAEDIKSGFSKSFDGDVEGDVDLMQSGHVSDPGIKMTEFWASPNLKRSCSNLETSDVLRKIADQLPPPSKSQSFEQLHELAERMKRDISFGSPKSVMSHGSADRVMLKKHSSSQVLPSRSRRLWWKLFLWSHRNTHKPWTPRQKAISAVLNQQGGYSSDTLEPNRGVEFSKMESPGSFTGESLFRGKTIHEDKQSWDGFHTGVSGLWPQNQWLAFPTESSSSSSPYARVEEWVKHLEPHQINEGENNINNEEEEGIVFPPETPSQARFPNHSTRRSDINLSEEILHANSVIQSLNSSSTVAHIAGIGLKAIPTISCFSSLRSVNLSNNFIVHITPGSLPKSLHSLNLSRNKISTIEGLRELTRDVEGLHRLLKLTVLDLSFNKITTAKALGQLVANYNSLQAMNLLGNPIQNNISEDQLRKAVCGLLPKLVYLNKQPMKPQRAREVLTDSVAKAALGNGGYNSRRKAAKKISQGGSSGAGHRTRHRSKNRALQPTPLMKASPAVASSSR